MNRVRIRYLYPSVLFLSAVYLLLLSTPQSAAEALGAPEEQADITVGCLYPMSGRAGVLGRDSVFGIRLALKYLEDHASPDSPRLRILLGDTKSKRSTAATLASRFIEDEGARFLCGVVNSSVAIEVTSIAKSAGAFFIGTDHASSRLTGEFFHDRYFRVTNDTRQSMTAGALFIKDYFADHLAKKPLRISYLGPDYEYGYQVWTDFREALARFGVNYEIAGVLWPRLSEPDYSHYINELIRQKPDLVVNSLWGGDFVAFVTQATDTQLFRTSRFANFEKGGDYEIFAQLGDKMPLGLLLASRHHNNWPDTEFNRWFVDEFQRKAGYYPSSGAQGAFTGIVAIAEAVKNAGANYKDLAAIEQAFEQLTLTTPEDPAGFQSSMDPDSHQIRQVMAIGETVPDERYPPAKVMLGNWHIYYPSELESGLTKTE
ncbi:ABC transporter substrate-binding protein [Marinobacter sediminum]|uniref:ABC transporter substrate-binding protein n=1 Tax=Marinobacter sediminum TaxID=256323 RepID=UPI00202F5A18|nr:ABC transporter substrate-binding protein [Marinobacter sediminum]MCM0614195.1 ABC transporter substrate-binding protein [Marinobacter sediminum]